MSRHGASVRCIAALLLVVSLQGRAASADAIRTLTLPTRDLAYDPYSERIYASVPGTAGANGNSVTVIDPLSGTIGASVDVGSEPGKLALSDDGRFLYVSLDGAGAVRRVQTSTLTAGLQFSLGNDRIFGPYFVEDMQVPPGRAESVAVARQFPNVSPRHAGVVIFDNDTPRAMTTSQYPGCDSIQFDASGQRLFGYDNGTTGFSLTTLLVAPAGVSVHNVTPGLISGFGETIRYDAGLIYAPTGQVVDPDARMVVGSFPGVQSPALVQPDSASGRVFFLSRTGDGWALLAFDSHSLQPAGSLPIPGIAGDPGSLLRWGPDGLAFRTSGNQVFLIRTSLVPAADLAVVTAPAAAVGGASCTGRVMLRAPAPTGGAAVRLASADPAAQPPAAVSVPAGAMVAAFPIATSPVGASCDVLVTAVLNGRTASRHLRVLAPVPDSITFAPGTVRSGGGSTATLALSGPAPAGGLKVWLSTANPAAVTVPESVTLPEGASTAIFPLATYAVAEPTSVLISASTAEGIYSSKFQVLPPIISALAFDPARVLNGATAVGMVTLADPAPAGGVTLQLSTDYPTVKMPSSVTVPAGARSATFTVATAPQPFTQSAYISARLGDQWVTQPLIIVGPEPVSLTLTPSTVIGGESVVARVMLSLPEPPGGGEVRFISDLGLAQVPEGVFLLPGENTATITVSTLPVTAPTTVKIIALGGESASIAAPLLLLPQPAASVSLDPPSVTGGEAVTGTVNLNAPAPVGGTVVALTGDNPAATVPAHVTVVAGASAALFTITTRPVASAATVHIGAAWSGSSASTTLVIRPPSLTSIRIQPDNSPGGMPVTITVTLNGPAPADGTPVHLSSSDPAAPVPPEVVVPPGASMASFLQATKPVSAVTFLSITAVAGGERRDWTLRLTPVGLSTLSVHPNPVAHGRRSRGVITLDGPAPRRGLVLSLSSARPAIVEVPSTLRIAAGTASASFPITTHRVNAATPVQLVVTLRGRALSTTLMVVRHQ